MGKIGGLLEEIAGARLYVDANIFIYFLAKREVYFEASVRLFIACDRSEMRAVTGDVTLAEILVKPYREKDAAAVGAVKRFFARKNFIELSPHSRQTFDLAAELRASRGGKLIDALHYATAMETDCRFFPTNDCGFASCDKLEVILLKDFLE